MMYQDQINIDMYFVCLWVQMVGVGTSEVNLDQFKHSFCSLLGTDGDSWGLSYTGEVRGHVTPAFYIHYYSFK